MFIGFGLGAAGATFGIAGAFRFTTGGGTGGLRCTPGGGAGLRVTQSSNGFNMGTLRAFNSTGLAYIPVLRLASGGGW